MKFHFQLLTSFLFLLFCLQNSAGQSKVLGRPGKYNNPADYSYDKRQFESFLEQTENKDRKEAWLVISDRDKNPVYDNINGKQISEIQFQDFFYVIEEKEGWIKLFKGGVDGLRITKENPPVGWVPKKNMLLWNSSLVDHITAIHKKGFLLNKASEIEQIIKQPQKDIEFAKIYKSPDKSIELENVPIHDFYFIMKYDLDNGTALLCKMVQVGPSTLDQILGWVSTAKMTSWNTRICLEPNFEEKAFNERKTNPGFQVRGFEDLTSAQEFAKGMTQGDKISWKEDPVLINKSYLAKSNPLRYKGSVVRFPMFGSEGKAGARVFRSGVIGKVVLSNKTKPTFEVSNVGEIEYAQIVQQINALKQSTQNLNIFFVVEATRSTSSLKPKIQEAIKQVFKDLEDYPKAKFGALVFRDVMDDKVTEYLSLTSDTSKVNEFIANAEFTSKDQDNYTCLFHAINESMQVAGFNKQDAQNFIIILGGNGDYTADKDRRALAEEKPGSTFYNEAKKITLYNNLSDIKAQIISIQLMREPARWSKAFNYYAQDLILETAKREYNKQYENADMKVLQSHSGFVLTEPSLENPVDELNYVPLMGGTALGSISMPSMGEKFTTSEISSKIYSEIKKAVAFEENLVSILDKIYIEGKTLKEAISDEEIIDVDVAAGNMDAALLYKLSELVGNMSAEEIGESLESAKYKLYTNVYFPSKIQGASFPSFSYVMFMPIQDLVSYITQINNFVQNEPSSYDEKRQRLFGIHKELVEKLAGEKIRKDVKDYTRRDVFDLLQGVENEGLELPVELNFRIGDILDETKVKDEMIDQLYKRYTDVAKNLQKILNDVEGYEFMYVTKTGQRYFWIPVKDAF
ncbi:MAG: type VI secretion system protein TssR domain-containing protein [Saprospiraceae bacterium]